MAGAFRQGGRPAGQVFGGYFHEDFDVQGEAEDVIDYFVSRNPGRVRVALDEFDRLLATDLSDEELDQLVESLGSVYWVEDGEVRKWLTSLRDRLAAHLSTG